MALVMGPHGHGVKLIKGDDPGEKSNSMEICGSGKGRATAAVFECFRDSVMAVMGEFVRWWHLRHAP
jgi:hypothetical protein